MGLSFWQILLVVVLLLLLFGRGKIPALMSDIASGIKGFRKEMDDDKPVAKTSLESGQPNTDTTITNDLDRSETASRSGQNHS